VDAVFGRVERQHEQVRALYWEPVLVVVETDEQDAAVRRQRPRGGAPREQREGDNVPDELVDYGARGGGFQRQDPVALGGDLAEFAPDLQRDVAVSHDSGGLEAAPDRSVGGPARALAQHQRERRVAAQASLLMQDRHVAESGVQAVAARVGVERCDPQRELVRQAQRLSDIRAGRPQLGDADLPPRLRPRVVVDRVHEPQPGRACGRHGGRAEQHAPRAARAHPGPRDKQRLACLRRGIQLGRLDLQLGSLGGEPADDREVCGRHARSVGLQQLAGGPERRQVADLQLVAPGAGELLVSSRERLAARAALGAVFDTEDLHLADRGAADRAAGEVDGLADQEVRGAGAPCQAA